jgi:type IV secretion system protein VirB8
MIDSTSKDYYEASKTWETEIIINLRSSKRIAWIVAAVGCLMGLAGLATALALTPLKEVVPYVIRVDNNSGATDIVTALDESTMTYDEALDKHWLSEYTKAREEYSEATINANYEKVAAMSAIEIGQSYYATIRPENPKSPLNTIKTGIIDLKVRNISFIDEGVAQVRYERIEKTNVSKKSTYWIATIAYQYLNARTNENDRLLNPLGFQITDYRIDIENIPVVKSEGLAP